MNEEKKEEPVLAPSLELVQENPPLPPRKYTRRNKRNNLELVPPLKLVVPPGLWTHERRCTSCDTLLTVGGSPHQPGTSDADWEMRDGALATGWDVRLLISGHLLYTCPRCLLKAA